MSLALNHLIGFGTLDQNGNDAFTKVLLHFDGVDASTTITDSNAGGSAHSWTANGNAQLDTGITPAFGTAALLCDGTGDYVEMSDHADLTLGSGNWTAECRFNRAGGNGTRRFMFGQSLNGNDATVSVMCELNASNVVDCYVGNGTALTRVTGTTTFTATGWNHVALVRTGNTLKLFVNGTQQGGDVSFTGSVHDSSGVFRVGALGGYASLMWNGSIDEFRLSVGVARWTANFTPPTRAYGS